MADADAPATQYWVSCPQYAARVEIRAGVITHVGGCPLITKFIGKTLNTLLLWSAMEYGDAKAEALT